MFSEDSLQRRTEKRNREKVKVQNDDTEYKKEEKKRLKEKCRTIYFPETHGRTEKNREKLNYK